MPIRPELRHHYRTEAWRQARAAVIERAGGLCERCHVPNLAVRRRTEPDGATRYIKVVLTVAHLDQNPANNDLKNLAALCQRCHLEHDRPHHLRSASTTRKRKKDARRPLLVLLKQS